MLSRIHQSELQGDRFRTWIMSPTHVDEHHKTELVRSVPAFLRKAHGPRIDDRAREEPLSGRPRTRYPILVTSAGNAWRTPPANCANLRPSTYSVHAL